MNNTTSHRLDNIQPTDLSMKGEQGMFKKVVQQGRRVFGARSVQTVREHDKGPRTPLAAFFNIP